MIAPSRLATGLTLTCIAGYIDALAFVELGGYFASFMSGNTTQLGLAMSGPDSAAVNLLRAQTGFAAIIMPLSLIALFFTGAFIASLLAISQQRWCAHYVLMLVAGLLLSALVLDRQGFALFPPLMLLAAAMGAQNATIMPSGAARLGITFVTGTLFNAASDLAKALCGQAPRYRWLQHMLVWSALVSGAALGAVMQHLTGVWALLLPAGILLLMALIALLFPQLNRIHPIS